jgi:parvulin-like peptidyl-prolyl isomerase
VSAGRPIPVLGPAPELQKAILETAAGKAIPAPVKLAAGYAVAFVRERTPERTPSFEEVRERVAKDYLEEKEAEVQGALVKELFEKHRVSVATDQFLPAAEEKKDGEAKTGAAPAGSTPGAPAGAGAAGAPAAGAPADPEGTKDKP